MNESYKCVRVYAWLRRYGNGAAHWKAFVALDFTQRASEALVDMHNIYCNASNKEIVAFFRGNQGRGQTAPAVRDDRDTSPALPWATALDYLLACHHTWRFDLTAL